MRKEVIDLIAIDIGNSRIKLYISNQVVSFDIKNFRKAKLKKILAEKTKKKVFAGICSVNPKPANKVIKTLKSLNIRVVKCRDLLESQSLIDFSNISGMGEDRQLGLIGALAYTEPPLITVDIGTAVTINVLDEKRICRGGVIFPGPLTQVDSLSHNTAGLRKVKLIAENTITASDTKTAIGNGILYGICGAVKEILEQIKFQNPNLKEAEIIMTGGGINLLKTLFEYLGFKMQIEEDLVLKGIIMLLKTSNV